MPTNADAAQRPSRASSPRGSTRPTYRRLPALRWSEGTTAGQQSHGTDFNIPVMYFTQLAGLALGADPKQLAIDKQVVSCAPVLSAIPA